MPSNVKTRRQFINSLKSVSTLPTGVDENCPICKDPFTDPVEVSTQHIFCKECITTWLTRRPGNTCPTCRRQLFVPRTNNERRQIVGDERIAIVARALHTSGLLTNNFNDYGYTDYTVSEIYHATRAAHAYLTEDQHAPADGTSAVIDMRNQGPHLIAMGNLLREYARHAGRQHSASGALDWCIIVHGVRRKLEEADGLELERGGLVQWPLALRTVTQAYLQGGSLDTVFNGFFASGGSVESPAGDLRMLVDYLTFQATTLASLRSHEREGLRLEQNGSPGSEPSSIWRTWRWVRQRLFGGV